MPRKRTIHGRRFVAQLQCGSREASDHFDGIQQPYRSDQPIQVSLPAVLPRQSGSGPWHVLVNYEGFTAAWFSAFFRSNTMDSLEVHLPSSPLLRRFPNGHAGQDQPEEFLQQDTSNGSGECWEWGPSTVHGHDLWFKAMPCPWRYDQPSQSVLSQWHFRRHVHLGGRDVSESCEEWDGRNSAS